MTHVVRGFVTEGVSKATGKWSHAEADNSVASGTSSHAEGSYSSASGTAAHAEGADTAAGGTRAHAEGNNCNASGAQAHAEGESCQASGTTSHAEGNSCYATATFAHAEGDSSIALRQGEHAKASGMHSVRGDAQITNLVLRIITTGATPSRLTSSGITTATVTSTTVNVHTLLASRAFLVRIEAVARRTDVQGEMAGFTWKGLVGRDSTGSARIIGTPVTSTWADAGAAAWTLAMSINTADATGNFLDVVATGEAAKTIRWVAGVYTTEVAG